MVRFLFRHALALSLKTNIRFTNGKFNFNFREICKEVPDDSQTEVDVVLGIFSKVEIILGQKIVYYSKYTVVI